MTVRRKIVVKRTRAQQSGTTSESSRPKRPRVDQGPRAYGKSKSGKWFVVVRFFVSQAPAAYRGRRWWVLDIEEEHHKGIARGTEKDGYGSKKEAIEIARQYRDEYGPYGKAPF